jgi:hypothetical protein
VGKNLPRDEARVSRSGLNWTCDRSQFFKLVGGRNRVVATVEEA